MMIESIFKTATIDAKEGRDLAIIDLPGAFLHVWNDKKVIIFMKGKLAELMVHIMPQIFRNYVTTNKNVEKILYIQVQEALY